MKLKIIHFIITYSYIVLIIFPNIINSQLVCGLEVCNPEGAVCNVNKKCKCSKGFITTIAQSNEEKEKISPAQLQQTHLKCNYRQIMAFKAGLIELILGCGIGHFYAGRNINGVIKLLCVGLFCTCCIVSLVMIKKIREESEAEDHPYVTILVFSAAVYKVVIILWQILDAFMFFFNVYWDGKNYPLY